jgi:hypothetical protein
MFKQATVAVSCVDIVQDSPALRTISSLHLNLGQFSHSAFNAMTQRMQQLLQLTLTVNGTLNFQPAISLPESLRGLDISCHEGSGVLELPPSLTTLTINCSLMAHISFKSLPQHLSTLSLNNVMNMLDDLPDALG